MQVARVVKCNVIPHAKISGYLYGVHVCKDEWKDAWNRNHVDFYVQEADRGQRWLVNYRQHGPLSLVDRSDT